MTTLHRKPRGVSEQSAALNTRYYTTIDILPSTESSASALTSDSNPNSNTTSRTGSSKTRRHGGSKYVRRSGFFGSRGSGNGGGSPSSSASKKMSTTQLRAFFATCVLVYLSTLYFAEDIVQFGKAVNSDATRQKIFSQWRPMHSAAKQYLRSIVDTANGGTTVDGGEAVTNATTVSEPPLVVEKESEMKKEDSGSPAPSMNSERQPPATAAPDVPAASLSTPPQDAPPTTTDRTRMVERSSSVLPAVTNEATANELAEVENERKQHEGKYALGEDDGFDADREPKSTEPGKEEAMRQGQGIDLPSTEMPGAPKHNDGKEPTAGTPRDGVPADQKTDPSHLPVDDDLRDGNDHHGADDAVEIEKEVQKAAAAAAMVADNDEFNPALMEDRMEDSVVAVESQENTPPGDVRTKKAASDLHPQQPPAAVVPSFLGGGLEPVSTSVVVVPSVVPTAAAAAIPTTLLPQQTPAATTSETALKSENVINGASPPPKSKDEVATHEEDGRVVVDDEEEERVSPTPPKEEEDTQQQQAAETTEEPRRHPGRDET